MGQYFGIELIELSIFL